ncbi:MAG: hypothetical protein SVR04_17885, partial [Spirochaetota bacterium]|nr:hypothetical protein [Spirochaetota bacterium]
MKRRYKRMLQLLITALLLLLVFSNYHIKRTTREYIYNSVEHVPANQTGLVLGTSRYLRGGGLNPYFQYRIEAAEKLFFRCWLKFKSALVKNQKCTKSEAFTVIVIALDLLGKKLSGIR